ncbi:hypothetical protein [Actinoallomurus rhizosphaericola]|uniref:hypothetical protein n=1 Tax=Actinoallomurus rhizosphaericola TaxID=2952536 RepID=UPI002093BF47|nr:hypothetical protein [Actinoallomurus rhizosphaericola]MCO5999094.1 hypothetical protein [Actinoallomurus rhizosphaericola]
MDSAARGVPLPRDGTWVTVGVRTDEEFAGLAAVAGLPGDPAWATLAGRKANESAVEEHLAAWKRSRLADPGVARRAAAPTLISRGGGPPSFALVEEHA